MTDALNRLIEYGRERKSLREKVDVLRADAGELADKTFTVIVERDHALAAVEETRERLAERNKELQEFDRKAVTKIGKVMRERDDLQRRLDSVRTEFSVEREKVLRKSKDLNEWRRIAQETHNRATVAGAMLQALRDKLPTLAEDTIELFIEYRDKLGRGEKEAKAAVVNEFREAEDIGGGAYPLRPEIDPAKLTEIGVDPAKPGTEETRTAAIEIADRDDWLELTAKLERREERIEELEAANVLAVEQVNDLTSKETRLLEALSGAQSVISQLE